MVRAPAQSQNVVAVMSMITAGLRRTAEVSCSATRVALSRSISSGSATTVSRRATTRPIYITSSAGSGRSRAVPGSVRLPRRVSSWRRPAQAHVQAGRGACLAGSGLDKITDLVDEPEAVAAQQLIGRGAVPGQRIGELASVGHLADDLSSGRPDLHRSAAVRVAQAVGGKFADGEHQVGDA